AWTVSFRSAYDHRKFAAQNFYTAFASDTAQETVSTFWNQLQLVGHSAKSIFRLQAGYKSLTDSFAFNKAAVTNLNKSGLLQVLATQEFRISEKTTLTPGLQYINKKINSNDRGNHNSSQAAAFLVWNQRLGESFFVAPAARLEWNERSGWEVVPQINLSYRTQNVQLRGSAGKTIRDADFTERFNNYNKDFVASGRIGNPALKAERSFSYEAGADYFVGSNVKIAATVFQRRHKNLIDYVTTPYSQMPRQVNLQPNGNYLLAKNIAEVMTSGVETDLQFTKKINTHSSLWAMLGFTWLNSSSSNVTPSLYVSSHAKYLTNFSLQYSCKRISLSTNGLYKMRQAQASPTPAIAKVSTDYFVLNVKIETQVVNDLLRVFLEMDNITDRNYTDVLGARMPGRWLMGGIKISLSQVR
ncbi:MAG: TonB-dependent receptor, partial [Chitinophagaceae bacterium]